MSTGFRKWNGTINTDPANDNWKPLGARDEEKNDERVSRGIGRLKITRLKPAQRKVR